jgi:hypothetical protein
MFVASSTWTRWRPLGFAGLACLMAGCPVNDPAPPAGRTVSFALEIQPILTERCASCHSSGGFAVNVGIPMLLSEGESYQDIVNQPSSQDPAYTLVVPSDSSNSLFYRKVSENNPPVGSAMPLFVEKLSPEELGLIQDWINQGAQDN